MTLGIRIGTAGWSIPKQVSARFPPDGSHLRRYSRVFDAVEINTSFYRPHRVATYQRWAAEVPEGFRFAVKVPRSVTHENHLRNAGPLLDRFVSEAGGLGEKLGLLLVQLPPSLAFDAATVAAFLADLTARVACPVACEPRHPSWFGEEGEALLEELGVARVAADPAIVPRAGQPGGWRGLAYLRLHGSPHMYHSAYDEDRIRTDIAGLFAQARKGCDGWCVFDNTAAFAATGNALMARALAGALAGALTGRAVAG